jgi:hypothetical protein
LFIIIPHEIAGDQQQPLLFIHPLHVDIDLKAVEIFVILFMFYIMKIVRLCVYDGYPTQNIINRIAPFFLRYTPKTASCYYISSLERLYLLLKNLCWYDLVQVARPTAQRDVYNNQEQGTQMHQVVMYKRIC